MDIKITYPTPKMKDYRYIINILRLCFLAASYICPIVNLFTGGKPWSLVVLWGLWFIWFLFISRDLVEYNRISQTAKSLVYTCILLILIDRYLAPGWASFVIPIVSFGALIVMGILFFTNIPKQKQNMMPMVWLIAASFAVTIIALLGWLNLNWPMVTLGSTAFVLLVVSAVILKKELLREIKKRFHVS